MLSPVRKGEELNEKNILAFLVDQGLVSSLHAAIDVQQFSNGYSNLTYLLHVEDKEYVLRSPPNGAVKRGHDMEREFKVLSALKPTFGSVPEAYAYTDDADVIGRPFYIMERIDGIILTADECVERSLGKEDFAPISQQWLSLFVDLHQMDYELIGLSDLGKPDGYVERQVLNWGKQYLKAATMDIPEAHKLMQWMEDKQPREYAQALIHNDYKYDNIVFEDDSWSGVKAVLDWEMCTIGDPLMDLGTSMAYWVMDSDGPAADIIPSATSIDGNPSREELLHDYSLLSGNDVKHEVFYYAYGLFKIAVIVQQIFFRYKNGLTSNKKFANLDRACALFCKMAWTAVQKNRIQNYM